MSVFAKIIDGQLSAQKVYEDDQVIAIPDICPQAPVHLLIITKKPWKNLQDIPPQELEVVAHIAKVAQELAQEFGIAGGYRLISNSGALAGQSVFHLHFHLLGGKQLLHLC